ncbi:patatin-like phospholipase family protein [Flexithrix dorotheae]|uniref:patatin-like phospholipase family protein n=1 Tax=Flexithrix dorotheae TaxID=70993 RepID=UPI000362FE54|nr:patatin-like phospholipase family protein [Flexithrix dorotheae]
MEKKIGICLCGGGARGIAHIGVLNALEDAGIKPSIISGSSMGAIVGTMYAAGIPPLKMLEIVSETSFVKIFGGFSLPKGGLSELTFLRKMLIKHLNISRFEELNLPMFICTTNLNTGKFQIFSEGDFIEPVVASSAIPLIFNPVTINNQVHVDGGVLNNLPVEPLMGNCDYLIGVNVNPYGEVENVKGLKEIGERVFDLTIWNNVENRLKCCNLVIEPQQVFSHHIFDWPNAKQIFYHGYFSAKEKIHAIKNAP